MTVPGVRREKAALSSGCESHPATAPAGSTGERRGRTYPINRHHGTVAMGRFVTSAPTAAARYCGNLITELPSGRAEFPLIAKRSAHAVGGQNLPSQSSSCISTRPWALILEGLAMTNLKLPRRKFLHLAAGAAALLRCHGSRGRKPIRGGRCESSLDFRLGARPMSLRA
jgi:hypothetical protein